MKTVKDIRPSCKALYGILQIGLFICTSFNFPIHLTKIAKNVHVRSQINTTSSLLLN